MKNRLNQASLFSISKARCRGNEATFEERGSRESRIHIRKTLQNDVATVVGVDER